MLLKRALILDEDKLKKLHLQQKKIATTIAQLNHTR